MNIPELKSEIACEEENCCAQWKYGICQDIGSRQEQQDHCGVVSGVFQGRPALLAVLADGMGGMKDGSAFSRITVEYHLEHFQEVLDEISLPAGVLLALSLRANTAANHIFDEDRPGGSTLVSALFFEDEFYTLSVGDSRIVLFRKAGLQKQYVPLQINREHTLGAALDERAWLGYLPLEDAQGNMYRHSLTSHIGGKKVKRVDFTDYPTHFLSGDRLVLMSDGIFKTVPENELAADLNHDPEIAASQIIENVCGKEAKGQDNMSVVVIGK